MSARMVIEFLFCLLGWVVSLAFIGGSIYIYYILRSDRDVAPLIIGGIIAAVGSGTMTFHLVTGKWPSG